MTKEMKEFNFAASPWHELGWYLEDQLKKREVYELSGGFSVVYLPKYLPEREKHFLQSVKQWQAKTDTREPLNNFDISLWLWYKRSSDESEEEIFEKFCNLMAILCLDQTLRYNYSRLYYIDDMSVVSERTRPREEDSYIAGERPFDSYRIRTFEKLTKITERLQCLLDLPTDSRVHQALRIFSTGQHTPLGVRRLGYAIEALETLLLQSKGNKQDLSKHASSFVASHNLHYVDSAKNIIEAACDMHKEAIETKQSDNTWDRNVDGFEALIGIEHVVKSIIKAVLDDTSLTKSFSSKTQSGKKAIKTV